VAEVTTFDHATDSSSNYLDSEAIEAGLSGHRKRVRARDDRGQWEMQTPTLATMLRFLKVKNSQNVNIWRSEISSLNPVSFTLSYLSLIG